jgi:peptide/nickel transport system permease protein
MAALFIVSNQAGLFPSRYAYSDSLTPAFSAQFVLDVAWHLMLPAACVALVSVGGWALTVRGAMLSTLTEDYITLAEAKGLPQRRILWHYAVRNAVLPNLTTFGRMLGVMLGGQLLAEIVFAYPGLGYLLLQAIRNQDYPLLQGLFLTLALAVLGVNLIIDLLHARLDPRVRRV